MRKPHYRLGSHNNIGFPHSFYLMYAPIEYVGYILQYQQSLAALLLLPTPIPHPLQSLLPLIFSSKSYTIQQWGPALCLLKSNPFPTDH